MKYVALGVLGAAVGVLVMRLLFPVVLEYNVAFLALPILLVATLLLARGLRHGRSGE